MRSVVHSISGHVSNTLLLTRGGRPITISTSGISHGLSYPLGYLHTLVRRTICMVKKNTMHSMTKRMTVC